MSVPIHVNQLEILGYATVLEDTMLPSVVPPLFRLVADKNRNYVPPYCFSGDYLCNSTEIDSGELAALVARGEVTLFDAPRAASGGFELWIDREFKPHYELRIRAHKVLRDIAMENIELAAAALASGKYNEAERFCGVALSADDRLVEPLAIEAAIRRLQLDTTGERMLTRVAAPLMSERAFSRLVGTYLSNSCQDRVSRRGADDLNAGAFVDFFAVRPMFGIASLRPI